MGKKKVTLLYCPKDYYNRHCFSTVGVDKGYIIHYCSQCHLCTKQKIKFIELPQKRRKK